MTRAAIVLMLLVAVACGSRGAASPEGRLCHDVNTLSLSGGPTTSNPQQVALTASIAASSQDINDEQLRAADEAFALHLTKSHLADPHYLNALVNACKRKGYLPG